VSGNLITCEAPDACHTAECRPRSRGCRVHRVPNYQACVRGLRSHGHDSHGH
jgi:hypothetical protein